MVRPVLVITGLVVVIVIGLALAPISSPLGTAVTVIGTVLLAGFLIVAYVAAWRGDQKRAWSPGSLRREYLAELKAKEAEKGVGEEDGAPSQR
jgi:hypothetical protein